MDVGLPEKVCKGVKPQTLNKSYRFENVKMKCGRKVAA